MHSKALKWLICILYCLIECWAVEYQILLENENIFSQCKEFPDNYLDEVFDFSNLQFEYTSDSNIHVFGDIVLVKELNDVPMQLDGQVFKKKGGEWIHTIYNIQRNDFCQALWENGEFWHNFTKSVAKEKRKCPPEQHLTISVDANSALNMDVPDRKLDGDYKAQIKLIAAEEWFVCFEILFSAVKLE